MNQTDGETAFELSRTFRVSQGRLFNALTDSKVLIRIWGVQQISVDARVGGKTEAVFVEGGHDWSFTLTYTEVVPNERLKWITHFKSFPSKETRVTVLFREAGEGTELSVRMENFETADERDANREAWKAVFGTLADILSSDLSYSSRRSQ